MPHRVRQLHLEGGQTLAEYALVLALVAVVAIGALLILGPAIANILQQIANQIPNGPTP